MGLRRGLAASRRAGRRQAGYPPGASPPPASANPRNGSTGKTVKTEDGPVRLEVPRDREGSFEPILIPEHARRFTGFDDKMYPVVFYDALRVKIREDAVVRNKAIYLAPGVLPDGTRDILGLWIEGTEGARFWMKVFNDLKVRGVADILIAVTDGLKGIGEALIVALRIPVGVDR